eukprot:gene614-7339_t
MTTRDAVEYIVAGFIYSTNMHKKRLPDSWDFDKGWDFKAADKEQGKNSELQLFFHWNR